jgi:hypothetical protein
MFVKGKVDFRYVQIMFVKRKVDFRYVQIMFVKRKVDFKHVEVLLWVCLSKIKLTLDISKYDFKYVYQIKIWL